MIKNGKISTHNPEVVGSSPASATKEPPKSKGLGGFLCFLNFVNGLSNTFLTYVFLCWKLVVTISK